MLTLLETLIAFVTIMLTLSLLVKSLTSVVKNHVDYYTDHLKEEAERLAKTIVGARLPASPVLQGIDWARLGEEFLSRENFEVVLARAGVKAKLPDASVFEGARQRVKWVFERRMKNLTLALGVGLCLLLDINAFRLWDSLYKDGQIRAAFSSETYIENILAKGDEPAPGQATDAAELATQREKLRADLIQLSSDVSFGLGEVWSKSPPVDGAPSRYFIVEFFGSLLTGFLVSIGAPYWHDLLRSLANLKSPT